MSILQKLSQLKGKKRAGAAFLFGVCGTLALPPFFVLPLLIISVCGWYLLLEHAETPRKAFFTGWWWGLGFFMSGLYWMCESLLVDAERFGWMIPFCLFGLNGVIAIYPAIASYLSYKTSKTWRNKPVSCLIMFVCCWSFTEFLRSFLFTGFPWNLIGYSWAAWAPAMQGASIFGIQGLTLITMLLAISPLALKYKHHAFFACIWIAWLATLAWGVQRIPAETELAKKSDGSPIQLRIVQASIPQTLKWVQSEKVNNIKAHIKLSQLFAKNGIDVLIWPESAIPLALNNEPYLMQDLTTLAPSEGELITGAIRVEREKNSKELKFYNSIFTINSDGIGDVYDKHHLVPFGEFVPFRNILPIERIAPGIGDYSRGTGPKEMILEHALPAFSPLVCYEAIFSDDVYRDIKGSVKWMVNLTNDAWFGKSTGPHQHFHITRFRAVEFGMPLVRSANNGISAVIDPYGRITASLGLDEVGVVDAPLPAALKPTWYSVFHYDTYLIMIFILLLICLISRHFKLVDAENT